MEGGMEREREMERGRGEDRQPIICSRRSAFCKGTPREEAHRVLTA